MKKILVLIFTISLFTSCWFDKGKYQVNYDVIYPDTTITYDTIFSYGWVLIWDTTLVSPKLSSWRGSNYIKIGNDDFNPTTCPIRINYYNKIE